MATLSVQQLSKSGILNPVVFSAAAAGLADDFPNKGTELLLVNNAATGTVLVTANSTDNCDQGFDHNVADTVAVAASTVSIFGPFPVSRFGPSVGLTYDDVTSVTVRCREAAGGLIHSSFRARQVAWRH